MKRRRFINNISIITGSVLASSGVAFVNYTKDWERIIASNVRFPSVDLPKEKRIPLGWKAFPIPANGEVSTLHFSKKVFNFEHIWLRITAAIDFREEVTILAFLPDSGEEIGQFDIRFAHPFQPFEIPVNPTFFDEIWTQGVTLKMTKGTKDAWFFLPDITQPGNQGLQPHLLAGENQQPDFAFYENLLSLNSISPFGWLGGCVHDALWEMTKDGDSKALQILKLQLSQFLDNEKGIIFENPMTEPRDGTFNSIEDFLPFAAIVGIYPNHPSIQMALDFLKTKENSEGMVLSWNHITTEGCYTVAYPLAAIAVQQNNRELAQKSLTQLVWSKKFLIDENAIYQNSNLKGQKGFRNWGRGIVWYLLGMVKTIAVLKESDFRKLQQIELLEKEFIRAMAIVVKWQNRDGMWCSFIDRPSTEIDTTATGGIAAAMAWGVNIGLLPEMYNSKAQKANDALKKYLTPDGFLSHVSQINRGGEQLQSNGYRVISQFSMGLLVQLENQLKR